MIRNACRQGQRSLSVTFGQQSWRSMFDAAGQGLQQASHRAASFQCTICCSMERTLKAKGSISTKASSLTQKRKALGYPLTYARYMYHAT